MNEENLNSFTSTAYSFFSKFQKPRVSNNFYFHFYTKTIHFVNTFSGSAYKIISILLINIIIIKLYLERACPVEQYSSSTGPS